MKMRIKGNSIRIRLTRSEVESFGKNGYLEEKTEFGDNVFAYALQSKDGITGLEAGFKDGKITVYVPATIPAEWAKNETVGYENNISIGNGKQLSVLIEKDFKCIDNAQEDQSDNYENPLSACN